MGPYIQSLNITMEPLNGLGFLTLRFLVVFGNKVSVVIALARISFGLGTLLHC